MRVVEQILDTVHGAGRNVGVVQGVEPFGIAARRKMAADEKADRLGVPGAAFHRLEAGVAIEQIGHADQLGKGAPMLVGINHQRQVTVLGRVGTAGARQQSAIAHLAQRRHKGAAAHMIPQHELGHGFEHRHFDFLALDIDRRIARRAVDLAEQAGDAGRGLHQIVIDRLAGRGAAAAIADRRTKDQVGVDGAQRRVVEAQPLQSLRPHI